MVVMKFGGTSVGNADAIQRCVEIVRSRDERKPVLVVSAVAKTTDELVGLIGASEEGDRDRAKSLIEWIVQKHLGLLNDLGLGKEKELVALVESVGEELSGWSEQLLGQGKIENRERDACVSWGEYLSCQIVSAALAAQGIGGCWVDSRKILRTDSRFGRARPLFEESLSLTRSALNPILDQGLVPVIQGFIGSDREGRTTTFGRGGSDFTATLLGALLEAEAVEIWTDVDGVMTADPSLVPSVRRIRTMTFNEAAELAYFGARVLHPSTIVPAVERGIPVHVLNSMKPDVPGTRIVPELPPGQARRVKSIAYKEGLSVLSIRSTRMLMAYGFLAAIFQVFNRYETAVDLVSTSEVGVSVTVDDLEHIDAIVKSLSVFAEVEIEHEKAIVCLVGEGICSMPGLAAQIFGELDDIRIHLISQGGSRINLSFVIDEADLPEVTKRLHDRFFSVELEEGIFA